MGITDPAEAHFRLGLWGHDGTVWRKLNLLWGFYDRFEENLSETKSGDGAFQAYSTVVPAGEVHVLQNAHLVNNTRAGGVTTISLYGTGGPYYVATGAAPAVNVGVIINGAWVLKAGDKVRLRMNTCLDGDSIIAGVWGYKMKVT